MRHHAFAAAVGVLTAAILAPCSPSQAATLDPTGYWYKPDAERESKIQVFKCGPGKTQLCAKIAWLKDPNDSKGRPLHDIRNEAPSMRDRPIVGLSIFAGLAPSEPGTWTGKIYNPEDGHTYSATLTVLSRKEIKLRGCKAWLLCGEKQWLRTSAPPPDVIEPTAPTEGGAADRGFGHAAGRLPTFSRRSRLRGHAAGNSRRPAEGRGRRGCGHAGAERPGNGHRRSERCGAFAAGERAGDGRAGSAG